jgi:hypothetical protein
MLDENTFINWCYSHKLINKEQRHHFLPYPGWTEDVKTNHELLNNKIDIKSLQNIKFEVGNINLTNVLCPVFEGYKKIIYDLTRKIVDKSYFINSDKVPESYDSRFYGMSWFKYLSKVLERSPGYNKINQEYKDKMSLLQVTISKIGNYIANCKKPQTNVYGSIRTDPYAFFSIGRSSCDSQSCFRQSICNYHHKMILGEINNSFVMFLSLSPLDEKLDNIKENVVFRCFGFIFDDCVFISNKYVSSAINVDQHSVCITNFIKKILKIENEKEISEVKEISDNEFYRSAVYYNRQSGSLFFHKKAENISLHSTKQKILNLLTGVKSTSVHSYSGIQCCHCKRQVSFYNNQTLNMQDVSTIDHKRICRLCLDICDIDKKTGMPII